MGRYLALAMLLLASVLGDRGGAHAAESGVALEYRVKAAFLINFLKFVRWPAGRTAPATAPWRIGIYGHNPFGDYLAEIARNKAIDGRPVEVVFIAAPSAAAGADTPASWHQLRSCHLAFVSREAAAALDALSAELETEPVLLVGETPGATAAGAAIRFFRQGTKVRLAIAPDRAKAAGLVISAKLLRLARIESSAR